MDLTQFDIGGARDIRREYPNAEIVRFNPETVEAIRAMAAADALKARRTGARDQHGLIVDSVQHDVGIKFLGKMGEFATSKYLGLFHEMAPHAKGPDIAGIIGVRTAQGHHRRLVLRQVDQPELPYVLATHEAGEDFVLLHGWSIGRDVMIPRFWYSPNEREPAWFIPPDELALMSDLFNFLPESTWRCCHNVNQLPF